MTEHERNIRDIGWTLSHRGQFRAACLAMSRKDLQALKDSFACAYGIESLARREYARFIATQANSTLAEFLAGEAS